MGCCCPDPRGGQEGEYKGEKYVGGRREWEGGVGGGDGRDTHTEPWAGTREKKKPGRAGRGAGGGAGPLPGAAGPAAARLGSVRLGSVPRRAAAEAALANRPLLFHNRATRAAIQRLRHPPREGRELSPGIWLRLALNRASEVRDLFPPWKPAGFPQGAGGEGRAHAPSPPAAQEGLFIRGSSPSCFALLSFESDGRFWLEALRGFLTRAVCNAHVSGEKEPPPPPPTPHSLLAGRFLFALELLVFDLSAADRD